MRASAVAEDDYHATGNCALEFTAADSARRAAKHAEPGVKMVELSNGYRVFTQTVGESADVKILTLHGGPACTHEYMTVLGDVLPESRGYEVIYYDQLGQLSTATSPPKTCGPSTAGAKKWRRYAWPSA